MKLLLQLSSTLPIPSVVKYKTKYEWRGNKLVLIREKIKRPFTVPVANPSSKVKAGMTRKRFKQSVFLLVEVEDMDRSTLEKIVDQYRPLLLEMFRGEYGTRAHFKHTIVVYKWSEKFKKWVDVLVVNYNITGKKSKIKYADPHLLKRGIEKPKLPTLNIINKYERELKKKWMDEVFSEIAKLGKI